MQAVFLAMSLHPEVQKTAQMELDRVVGPSRLPDFRDLDSLVYVRAVLKEAMRWHTVTPLGIPHRTKKDDVFDGYFVPAGTILIANIWCVTFRSLIPSARVRTAARACMHDPDEYEDPDEFRPERFIRDGKLDPNIRDPLAFAFGFGRRHVSYVVITPFAEAYVIVD